MLRQILDREIANNMSTNINCALCFQVTPEERTFLHAARQGDVDMLRQILDIKIANNMSANIKCVLYFQVTPEERTFLHAARQGDVGMLRQILDSDEGGFFNPNCMDFMGRNALHLAVDSESVETIELLLEW